MWDFGEGSKSEKRDPTHRYEAEGNYSVSLHVTDESGLSTFRTNDILVTKSKVSQKTSDKNSLKAYFIVAKKSDKVNEAVDFDNRSRSRGSEIKSYLWQFGDGETSTIRNPKHQYKKAGKYVVKYKVCSADGTCAYASTSVKIVEVPTKEKPAVKEKKRPAIDAKAGEDIQDYIASHGQPSKKIVKKKGTPKAYKFGNIWLLAKRGKIECAVTDKGLSTNLMGQPKKCHWHAKHSTQYMVELK